ncbi:hypothetical protein [Mycobacterium sp. 141]|uniref:hypothetical protein n=1 Tax=Mycobacterium sp. 141 TaxID=1120797 RepID=UPI00037FBE8C|nr:hypothetical protein [Mycobacterium sp. 141]
MSLGPRRLILTVVAAAVGVSLGYAIAAADPRAGTQSAADIVDDLTAQGYQVQINWVSGVSSEPLSRCKVTAIHNPDRSPGTTPANTTVYVDVSCPNEADDSSVSGGIGIGFG